MEGKEGGDEVADEERTKVEETRGGGGSTERVRRRRRVGEGMSPWGRWRRRSVRGGEDKVDNVGVVGWWI